MAELDGRVALITGASRGIGRAVALRFARAGAHVVLVGRVVKSLERVDDEIRAAGGQATLVPLDVTDGPGVDRLGGGLAERFGRLDILVANAGLLGDLSPLSHIRPEVWDRVIAVNLSANWRLIRSLDPLLRQAPAGRALFVTSGAARGKAYWGPYAVSKAALECLVRVYAQEVAKSSLKVNLVNPGPVRTAMRAAAMPGEDPETLPGPETIAEKFLPLVTPTRQPHGAVITLSD